MASNSVLSRALLVLIPVVLGVIYAPSIQRPLHVLGFLRETNSTEVASSEDLVTIEDTIHCEDLHYHIPTNTIFTACEDVVETRFVWFPPLANFQSPEAATKARGSIHVIDDATKKSRRLSFENFEGPFVTHGIDVIDELGSEPKSVLIFAINHPPSDDYLNHKEGSEKNPKASSRVEIFRHVLGSNTARHLRTVQHPLITTPNDIFAKGPNEFYVTNDHYYREGHLRTLEDVYFGATWSTTIHVALEEAKVNANVAVSGLHNNNGLGHGRTSEEVLIGSAASGNLHLGKDEENKILIEESIHLDSCVDNPNYFKDPYADDKLDASGFVMAGLSHGFKVAHTSRDPAGSDGVLVWLVRPGVTASQWQKELLFVDDGNRVRSASVAVLVAIDPAKEDGKRKAWLYVTGFMSQSTIAVKIDLMK